MNANKHVNKHYEWQIIKNYDALTWVWDVDREIESVTVKNRGSMSGGCVYSCGGAVCMRVSCVCVCENMSVCVPQREKQLKI